VELVDLSANNPPVDWAALDQVIEGVSVKLTDGVGTIDPKSGAFCAGARSIGAELGGYHFLRIRAGRPQDGAEQAKEFVEQALLEGCSWCCVDIEGALKENRGTTGAEAREALTQFVDTFHDRCTLPLVLYTDRGDWQTWGAGAWAEFAYLPLWLAALVMRAPVVPLPWTGPPLLHQYSWTGKVFGVTGLVDRSRFAGTRDEFRAALGICAPPAAA
jgi:GH25 family lysozyme M1 (1,4-beta-N-acetylmuramidase)